MRFNLKVVDKRWYRLSASVGLALLFLVTFIIPPAILAQNSPLLIQENLELTVQQEPQIAKLNVSNIKLLASGVNTAPVVGTNNVLYDGALGTGLPQTQGFIYLNTGISATQNFASGVTTLDTTPAQSDKAGYFRNFLIVPGSPILDRTTGYAVKFSAQVVSETHASTDRAGFSLIAISSDGLNGIELGFWTDEIWAQEGGTNPQLFTHAEGTAYDTTTDLLLYELTILDDTYSLAVSNTQILSGSLRDYSAFTGLLDPYESPNLIFLGDDTTSAQAKFKLSYVSVITNIAPPDRSVDAGTPLVINDVGLLDIDAWGSSVVVTLSVNSGTLTVNDTVVDGLTAAGISGNGSSTVQLTGSVGQINSTLTYSPALTYTSNGGFSGIDIVTVTINDQGNTGSGGPLSDTKSFNITVLGQSDLDISKSVTPNSSIPGQTITYTLALSNPGNTLATGVIITDDLPVTITNIISTNSGATITPTVGVTFSWTVEDLSPNENGIITITGQISSGVSGILTNTAEITSTSVDSDTSNNTSTATLTVNGADLAVGKWVISILPIEGETITYTIVITNNGPNTATNVVISDVLPTGITYGGLVTGSPSQGSYSSGSMGVWQGITLTNGVTASLVYTATIDNGTAGHTLVNTVAISSSDAEDGNTANNSTSASVTVSTFDLTISKDAVRSDEVITYTIIAQNNGPTAAPGAIISDSLPAGVLSFTWSCSSSTGVTCLTSNGTGLINEATGAFPAGEQLVYTVRATAVNSTAVVTNTTTITSTTGSGDSDSTNNRATHISKPGSDDIYLPIILR